MACVCKKCGLITSCDEDYCMNCYIDECMKDKVSKNIFAGGRFYDENLEKEVNNE